MNICVHGGYWSVVLVQYFCLILVVAVLASEWVGDDFLAFSFLPPYDFSGILSILMYFHFYAVKTTL